MLATQWHPAGRVLPSSAFFRGMAGRIQKCSVMLWAHGLYTEYSPILSSFCNVRLILSARMLFRAAQQTNLRLRSPIFYLQRALACEILLQIRNTTTAVVVQVRGELTMQGNPCPIVEQYFALMSTFIRTIGFAAVKRIPSR